MDLGVIPQRSVEIFSVVPFFHDASNRHEEIRIFFEGEENFEISDLEIQREGKSYTVDTMTAIKEIYPDDELFLIIGSDMLLSFNRWYRFRDILSMCTLCVASRLDTVSAEDLSRYASETLVLDSGKDEIILADIEPFECSSTEIRDKLKEGTDVRNFVTDKVYDYIRLNLLYESPFMNYKRLLREKLDDYRLLHSFNVADSAVCLARMYGADEEKAYFAGLLHDIGKAITSEKKGAHALLGAEFLKANGEERLVCDAVAAHHLQNPQKLCEVLAEAMKYLHSRPIEEVPVSACMDIYAKGENAGKLKQDTFIHGDFCLPNIFLEGDTVSGFIDLGRCGIADKYQDIALCWRSLGSNARGEYGGPGYAGFGDTSLFDALGLAPDWDMVRYYVLLDELF